MSHDENKKKNIWYYRAIENHDRYIYLPLERQYNKGRLLLSLEATSINSVDPDQTTAPADKTAPVGAVWSGSKLFAYILTLTN